MLHVEQSASNCSTWNKTTKMLHVEQFTPKCSTWNNGPRPIRQPAPIFSNIAEETHEHVP